MLLLGRFVHLHAKHCGPFTALGLGRAPRSGARSCSAMCRHLRVLVDMDGVLADFEGGFLKKFRARFPEKPYIALEDRRGFWVSEQYGQLRSELSEKAISIWESKNFFIELDPIPGAVEAVKQMAKLENTDVFICTSPIKKYRYCAYEKCAAHCVKWRMSRMAWGQGDQVIRTSPEDGWELRLQLFDCSTQETGSRLLGRSGYLMASRSKLPSHQGQFFRSYPHPHARSFSFMITSAKTTRGSWLFILEASVFH
uniref:Uncharacterized protein n=1 Tax=Gopherus agassizii TaxID=38772 RepID=A0A452HI77_9SAUR